jgi:hypothetical protein
MADTRKRSIRRGQVWTSLVRIAADAAAEGHRARMMREADEHAKALALAVEDEEICACRLAVTWSEGVPVLATTEMVGGVVQSRTIMVGTALLEANLRDTQREVDRLRATTPKVPPPRPGAERFEAPLVRDKAAIRAMGNKYVNAPAGTRAAHKRTPPPADAVARAARTTKREQAQRWRRATGLFFKTKGARVEPRLPWGVSLHYSDGRWPVTCAGSIGRTIVEKAIGVKGWRAAWRDQAKTFDFGGRLR